jgi:KaiC/GvpD/RAD55 family RecA-like ATPase
MDYELAVKNTPDTIPAGTGMLLLHPSTGETDRIDTEFLKTDTDHMLIISTRTTAREVEQKLEYYEVDEDRAVILDTLSIERGYTRRSGENLRYVASPDDLAGIVDRAQEFLESHEGKLRISVDSITEMAYYADEDRAFEAVEELLNLIELHDAVALFHLATEVHDDDVVQNYRDRFGDNIIELDADGTVTSHL